MLRQYTAINTVIILRPGAPTVYRCKLLIAPLDVDRNGRRFLLKGKKREGPQKESKKTHVAGRTTEEIPLENASTLRRLSRTRETERGWRGWSVDDREGCSESRGYCSGQSSDRRAWNKTQLSPPNFDFRGSVTRKTFSG